MIYFQDVKSPPKANTSSYFEYIMDFCKLSEYYTVQWIIHGMYPRTFKGF
jgi:hypothetical protein